MWKRFACAFIIVAIVLLPYCALGVNVRVIQIWDDVDNHDRLRPEEVTVTIETEESQSLINDSEIHTIPGSTYVFSQDEIPSYISRSHVNVEDDLVTIIFLNTHQVSTRFGKVGNALLTADLVITKEADYASSSDLFYFTVHLAKAYEYTTTAGITGTTDSPVPLHSGESAIIADIPVGTPYTVTEVEDPRYVTSSVNSSGIIQKTGSSVVFTNSLITTTFRVNKLWQGTAHDTITLHLYADGEEVEAAFEKDGNTYTALQLPKYAVDGHEIQYFATEEYMREYMTMYLNVGSYANRTKAIYNGGTIVNKQVTSFSVRKDWVGVSEGNRPKITFQLYQNGLPIVWRQPEYRNGVYVWENLPAMKDGELASYYVLENPIDGYETSYKNPGSSEDQKALNGGIITNYKIPKTGDQENPALLIVVIALSLVCITAVMLRKRR